jgi:hypothetical protein
MSNEKKVLGKDVVVGNFYRSPKGTIVKITKNVENEVFGVVDGKNVVVRIPSNLELVFLENYCIEESLEKEEKVKVEKEEKVKVGKVEKEEKVEKVKVEKNQKEEKELYEKIRSWMGNISGTKLKEKCVIFKIGNIKCHLYQDSQVLTKEKIEGKEPNKIYKNNVFRYHIKDLYDKIGYKE